MIKTKEIYMWIFHKYWFYLYCGLRLKEMSVNLMENVLVIFIPGQYLFFHGLVLFFSLLAVTGK